MATLVLALCSLLAAAGHARGPLQGGTLAGRVLDPSGAAVADAIVTVATGGPALVTGTAADGRFRVVITTPGTFVLTVSKPGFRPFESADLELGSGESLSLDIVLHVGGVAESVDVRARRRTAASSVRVTEDDLRNRPVPRDPAGLLASVPGVMTDRVDVAGSESLNAPQFVFRGGRAVDTAWTIDGIVVTDRQSGRAPGFFDVEALADVQMAPASHDIAQPGSGLGVRLTLRSGTNAWRGSVRGFFTNDTLQSASDGDHTRQILEYGADVGGPLRHSRLWVLGSMSERDVRVFRLAGGDERAEAAPRHVKVTWQATRADLLDLLWLDHAERRYGLNPASLRAPVTALQDLTPYFPGNPLRGLWKIENRRSAGPLWLSTRYAYYGLGYQSLSRGSGQAGFSPAAGETVGATSSAWSQRPQHTAAADASGFHVIGRTSHDIRLGGGWQRLDMFNGTRWPGDGVVAFDLSPSDRRARIYREAASSSRLLFLHAYASDTLTRERLTLDFGVRLDHQKGEALPGRLQANPAFPHLMPAVDFAGMSTQSWTDLSPRAALSYALTVDGGIVLRASVGRFAAQQVMASVVQTSPVNGNAWIEYPWEDSNGDRLAQPHEVRVDLPYVAFDGFNPLDPTSTVPASRLDPEMSSRRTTAAAAAVEANLGATVSASLGYNYARHTNWPGLQWEGLSSSDYRLVRTFSGELPDGTAVSIPIYEPDPVAVAASGGRRIFVTDRNYYSTFHGIEGSLVRRMAYGWTMGVSAAWHNSRGFYRRMPASNSIGNPTRLDGSSGAGQLSSPKDPLVQGGQVAPSTLPIAGGGRVFMNARWQVAVTATARLPWGVEGGANLSGRDGHPSPYIFTHGLGLDGTRTLLALPTIDAVRLEDVWNLDLRISKSVPVKRLRVQAIADLFNALNGSAALVKDRNLRSQNFDRVNMSVSPRILRLGLRISY